MKQLRYKKIDAFTSGESLGNPAACLFIGKEQLSESEMLSIARQHKGFVSEVVFCSDSATADCKLTYYSSECEVDFCGHGTIAAMYELIKNNEKLRSKSELLIDTNKKGRLTVYNRIAEEDAVYITAPQAQYLTVPVSVVDTAGALNIPANAISDRLPVDFIDAGLKTLIVPLNDHIVEISLFPDEKKLKQFCLDKGIDIILIFTRETGQAGFISHTRVFAPKFGYLEDPATGSGNSTFGNYMLKNVLWDGSPVAIEQGGNDRVFNTVKLTTHNKDVLFGGRATLRIDGVYII
ncbi:MAG: PhzF family phenazine biosynthesis isomerase [Dehalococcoidales bacterium]|nr:PhzF family phenazine biosynthesis isomerase [Dehalococcoidales bacterium]